MLEITSTRANPLVDPHLTVWAWEIPVYLFVGGLVAGMMILAGMNMLRIAQGKPLTGTWPVQAPLLGFVLMNVGMGALFLDLAHKLYVWAVYLTFQPGSPMSWGSWVLLLVYPVLLVSALIRLPQAWPWLGERLPSLQGWSDRLTGSPGALRVLGALNVGLGIALGIYTGILLNTMVARPLWNSAILGPLFLFSGLSAAAALMHLVSGLMRAPAPRSMIGGAISALCQPLTASVPEKHGVVALTRADVAFLAVELVLIVLLFVGLTSSSASHIAAAQLLLTGPYATMFLGGVVVVGILVPIVLQLLELSKRFPHTVLPALLVLAGGFMLRWVMVNAGQMSHMVAAAGY